MSAPIIEYQRGMTLADFQLMIEQMRTNTARSTSLDAPDTCEHPFGDVRKSIRAKQMPGEQIRIIVEYQCAACYRWLGHDRKLIRT